MEPMTYQITRMTILGDEFDILTKPKIGISLDSLCENLGLNRFYEHDKIASLQNLKENSIIVPLASGETATFLTFEGFDRWYEGIDLLKERDEEKLRLYRRDLKIGIMPYEYPNVDEEDIAHTGSFTFFGHEMRVISGDVSGHIPLVRLVDVMISIGLDGPSNGVISLIGAKWTWIEVDHFIYLDASKVKDFCNYCAKNSSVPYNDRVLEAYNSGQFLEMCLSFWDKNATVVTVEKNNHKSDFPSRSFLMRPLKEGTLASWVGVGEEGKNEKLEEESESKSASSVKNLINELKAHGWSQCDGSLGLAFITTFEGMSYEIDRLCARVDELDGWKGKQYWEMQTALNHAKAESEHQENAPIDHIHFRINKLKEMHGERLDDINEEMTRIKTEVIGINKVIHNHAKRIADIEIAKKKSELDKLEDELREDEGRLTKEEAEKAIEDILKMHEQDLNNVKANPFKHVNLQDSIDKIKKELGVLPQFPNVMCHQNGVPLPQEDLDKMREYLYEISASIKYGDRIPILIEEDTPQFGKWYSVKDKPVPINNKETYIFKISNDRDLFMGTVDEDMEICEWAGNPSGLYVNRDVTHWMPAPPLPTE